MLYNGTLREHERNTRKTLRGQCGKCKNLEKPEKQQSPEQNLGGTGHFPQGICFKGFLEVFVCLLVFSRFGSHVLFQSTWEWCTGACCSEFFWYFANAAPMVGPSEKVTSDSELVFQASTGATCSASSQEAGGAGSPVLREHHRGLRAQQAVAGGGTPGGGDARSFPGASCGDHGTGGSSKWVCLFCRGLQNGGFPLLPKSRKTS